MPACDPLIKLINSCLNRLKTYKDISLEIVEHLRYKKIQDPDYYQVINELTIIRENNIKAWQNSLNLLLQKAKESGLIASPENIFKTLKDANNEPLNKVILELELLYQTIKPLDLEIHSKMADTIKLIKQTAKKTTVSKPGIKAYENSGLTGLKGSFNRLK